MLSTGLGRRRGGGHSIRVLGAALICFAACQSASAMEAPVDVGLHLGTWHSGPGFCSNTPGVFARWQSGLTIGAFKNSECERYSGYAGWTWESAGRVRAAITVGMVTGYKLSPVLPLVAPSIAVDLTPSIALRMTYMPKIAKDGAHAINFAIQHSFR